MRTDTGKWPIKMRMSRGSPLGSPSTAVLIAIIILCSACSRPPPLPGTAASPAKGAGAGATESASPQPTVRQGPYPAANERAAGTATPSAAWPYPVRTPTSVPTETPTDTPTPASVPYPEYAGLVYRTSHGLWQIQADGRARLVSSEPYARLSPDGRQVLYEWLGDLWITDVGTGESVNVTQTEDRWECCARWWPARPDLVLFGSQEVQPDGPFADGFLSVVQTSGAGYRVLDDGHLVGHRIAPSPDGDDIAYGAGRLYSWRQQSSRELTAADFGLPNLSLYAPAWAPEGRRIAWTVVTQEDREYRVGTVVLDLERRTGTSFHFFEPVGFDGPLPPPRWHLQGEWLAVDGFAVDLEKAGVWVFPMADQTGGGRQLEPIAGFAANKRFTWSPDGRYLAVTLPARPDGSILIYEVGTWQPHQLSLGLGGRVVQWVGVGGE